MAVHQYVERKSNRVVNERLFGDRIVNFLYSMVREKAPVLFALLTSKRATSLLGLLNFDMPLTPRLLGNRRFLEQCGVDLAETLDPPESFTTARKIFERKIRYWDHRPMPEDEEGVVLSPADSRMIPGTLKKKSLFLIKGNFFDYDELLGRDRNLWLDSFQDGDFAIFRLTPDKYHYDHCPVTGVVEDFYEMEGSYHSCNPGALISVPSPYSKNRRSVTIINTEVPGGTKIGFAAMVEVAAMMIGRVVQCYSDYKYHNPVAVKKGLHVRAGQPKSLYKPGSSTTILFFQRDRIDFFGDILLNHKRADVQSRFSLNYGYPLVETEVAVRSGIAKRRGQ